MGVLLCLDQPLWCAQRCCAELPVGHQIMYVCVLAMLSSLVALGHAAATTAELHRLRWQDVKQTS